jgi:hypothetical protein
MTKKLFCQAALLPALYLTVTANVQSEILLIDGCSMTSTVQEILQQ